MEHLTPDEFSLALQHLIGIEITTDARFDEHGHVTGYVVHGYALDSGKPYPFVEIHRLVPDAIGPVELAIASILAEHGSITVH